MEENTNQDPPSAQEQDKGNEAKTPKQPQQKPKPKRTTKKPNPYQNTDMAAIKLLRQRQRVSKKKVAAAQDVSGSQGQESALPPATPTDGSARGRGAEQQDKTLEEQDTRAAGDGQGGDTTGRTSTLPPVDECRGGRVGIRKRYTSASLKSLYLREDEKRRSKGSAGTRKSNSLVFEVGGGSLMTYTGVQQMRKECLEQTTQRLAQFELEKGVPDAHRTIGPEVVKKCGLTASFQWTAGGQRCHGFMW